MAKREPRVVAELGRPETPAETAARKAEDSRLYRSRKTWNNLVLSLIVSLGLVAVMVMVVPRGTDTWSDYEVDAVAAAADNSEATGFQLIAPTTPPAWKAKHASLRSHDDKDLLSWHVGYTTENENYAEIVQAFTKSGAEVSESWVDEMLDGHEETGQESIGGLSWTVYDHTNLTGDSTNVVFGLEAQQGATTLLVFGTDRPEVIRTLAAEVASQAQKLNLNIVATTPEGEAP